MYPGWYDGRTVHFHAKVHLRDRVVHTGQMFFPDEVTDEVLQNKLYASRGPRPVRNSDDGLFRFAGFGSTFALQPLHAGGYAATIALAVRTGEA